MGKDRFREEKLRALQNEDRQYKKIQRKRTGDITRRNEKPVLARNFAYVQKKKQVTNWRSNYLNKIINV